MSSHNGPAPDRFLGLTKFQFMAAVIIVLILAAAPSITGLVLDVRENQDNIDLIKENQAKIVEITEQAARDHEGLCAFVRDLDRRADNTRAILEENTGPTIFGGIPRASVEQSLANQESTLNALAPLECN